MISIFQKHRSHTIQEMKAVGCNAYGYPTCPNDPSLDMKYCGVTNEKGHADHIKRICPKMHYHKGGICDCKNPCSTAKNGRTTYTYKNMDLRMFPGIQRDSKEWNDAYKIRTIVERTINRFKINMCIAGRKTRNHTTTKADVFSQVLPASWRLSLHTQWIVHNTFEAWNP